MRSRLAGLSPPSLSFLRAVRVSVRPLRSKRKDGEEPQISLTKAQRSRRGGEFFEHKATSTGAHGRSGQMATGHRRRDERERGSQRNEGGTEGPEMDLTKAQRSRRGDGPREVASASCRWDWGLHWQGCQCHGVAIPLRFQGSAFSPLIFPVSPCLCEKSRVRRSCRPGSGLTLGKRRHNGLAPS